MASPRTIVLTLLVAGLAGCGVHTAPFRDADGNVVPGSIASMQKVSIGGLPQQLWFRGLSTSAPALILLHGGPGASESPLFRHYDPQLEQHFLVVYWDQRGSGRSFDADTPKDSMTMAQFVRDLDELVDLVRRRFDKEKVVLLGHSWGSALGLLYTAEHGDKVAAYVGTGQVADMRRGERLSYEYGLDQAIQHGKRSAIDALQEIGPPPHDVDAMLTSRKWVEQYGGSFHADLSTGGLIWAALSTDEANLVDLVAFGRGNRFSLESLWPEFSQLDLTDRTSFAAPIFFLLGRHDWQVPAVVAAAYFDTIQAPCKRLVWFEESAHNPPFEEAEKFQRVMIDEVLPVAEGGACPPPLTSAR